MSQKPLQLFFSENPFKKRIIIQKTSNNAPIVEQNLIIHHKRNLKLKKLFLIIFYFHISYLQVHYNQYFLPHLNLILLPKF